MFYLKVLLRQSDSVFLLHDSVLKEISCKGGMIISGSRSRGKILYSDVVYCSTRL